MEHLGVKKGAWTEEEDILLKKCIEMFGEGKWRQVPFKADLRRCHKSCRLRWLNYLKPDIKRGQFKEDEVDLIIRLHKLLGNRWSLIAGRLPGRTSNDVKNYWNCHLSRRLTMQKGAQSRINSINSTAANAVVATKIIRPKPLSFSPNSKWLSGTGSSTIKTQVPKMSNNPMLGSPQEESTSWWNSLMTDVDKEDNKWWPKSAEVGQEKDLPEIFVVEKMERMRKEEDKVTMEEVQTQVPKMSNNPTLGSPQEESTSWWKSLMADVDKEDNTWWPKSAEVGQEKDLPESFVVEEMERMRKEEDKVTMEKVFGELDNMLLDVDLWGLLETS